MFISRLGRHVGDRPAIEIQNELIRSNPNINNIQVHKIKHYYHIIKVVCEDTETADAVIRDGLFAFHTKIAASQCKKEQFTELITCFRCYKFEDHFSSDCKTTQIICSECAQIGHTHRDCHAVEKRSINCPPGQNFHRTLAPFCPVRKDAIAQKQQKLKNASEIQNNKTNANVVKTTIKETTPPAKPVINLTEKHHLKYVILILEAHIASIGDGRPYNVILQESLKANNIDAVIPNRDSQKIMDIYTNPKQKQKDHAPEEFLNESSSSSDDESSDEEELQPPQTEDEAPPKTQERSDNRKNEKRKKNSSESTSAPHNKQPRHERLATPRPPNPKPSTSSGLHRTPPNPSSQEQRRPSISSEFQWTAPNPSPNEKRRPPPIIYRSRDDSEAIPNVLSSEWIKNEFKKEKFGLKAHCYGKAEDFMNKILRGEVFIDPKRIKFMEHKQFKALTKITGQDSY